MAPGSPAATAELRLRQRQRLMKSSTNKEASVWGLGLFCFCERRTSIQVESGIPFPTDGSPNVFPARRKRGGRSGADLGVMGSRGGARHEKSVRRGDGERGERPHRATRPDERTAVGQNECGADDSALRGV